MVSNAMSGNVEAGSIVMFSPTTESGAIWTVGASVGFKVGEAVVAAAATGDAVGAAVGMSTGFAVQAPRDDVKVPVTAVDITRVHWSAAVNVDQSDRYAGTGRASPP